MELNAKDFMTENQRKEVGAALTAKLIDGIASIEIAKGKKLNVHDLASTMIRDMLENDDVYEHIDFDSIGKRITKKVVEGI